MEEETSVVLRDSKEKREIKVVQEIVTKSNKEQPRIETITTSSVNFAAFRSTIEEICQNKQDDIFSKDSPMSLEKSLEKSLTYSSSSNKEYKTRREYIKEMSTNFFDVDEYRADIYNYLRISEVCICLRVYI